MTQKCQTKFAQSLRNRDEFTLTFELVPSRGARSKEQARSLALAEAAAADGRIKAVSITENAGGHPALSPEVLGLEIKRMGLDVIIHVSCKDKNRNQMESLLFAWGRENLHNLLVIGGDYPQRGFGGNPKPVFDLDSVQVLDLLEHMNRGLTLDLPPSYFFKGVAISPFKFLEAELMMQYFKLHRKVAAGADYVITQLGYDARKFEEVLLYMRQTGLHVPILGSVFIPNLRVAELMYQGAIPGCVIPERLYEQILKEATASDKGRRARLLRAAKLLCVLKGLGYDGAHIGGPGIVYADIVYLLDKAETFSRSWRDLVPELTCWPETGFHFFAKDPQTGLNKPEPSARRTMTGRPGLAYASGLFFHDLFFEEKGLLFHGMRRLCLVIRGTRLEQWFGRLEHILKFLWFGCQNCGDCTLAELAYLCPQSGCAKNILNGPCGGSRDGWCEVYPGLRRCHYVGVYERLRATGREEEMKKGMVAPRDWALNNTSSWMNFYAQTDHRGRAKTKVK